MTGGIGKNELREMEKSAQAKLASARHSRSGGYFGDASSRAYYAVYHILSALLATRGLSFSSHAQVLGAFNREFIHPDTIAGVRFRDIQKLFDDRQKGDYATMLEIGQSEADNDIEIAQSVLDRCNEYLQRNGLLP